MPIYRVQLTLPGGETEELDKIDDWYLFGDSFVLYNDNENHLTEAGNYTLTIWADGFQSFSEDFLCKRRRSVVFRKYEERRRSGKACLFSAGCGNDGYFGGFRRIGGRFGRQHDECGSGI